MKYVQQKETPLEAIDSTSASVSLPNNTMTQTTANLTNTPNKILAMLDNMLPNIRHTKLPNESISLLSLVSDSEHRNHNNHNNHTHQTITPPTAASNNNSSNSALINKISYKSMIRLLLMNLKKCVMF